MRANLSVHEPRATQDADSALAFSMEGANGSMSMERPSELLPFAWSPGWNSPQAWNKFQAEVGGQMKGGDSGEPVIVTDPKATQAYFGPGGGSPGGELRVVPMQHLFGSEEQSGRAEVIVGRAPKPYVAISRADAQRLGIAGGQVTLAITGGASATLPVHISDALVAGTVGLPVGLAGVPYAAPGSVVSVGAA
jgi:NADH-quinone oxidoreductase subunit G